VPHTCNPSYLEGGDREDRGLRPDQGKEKKKKAQETFLVGAQWYTPVTPRCGRRRSIAESPPGQMVY
jgi:hypothetical protein